MAEAPGEASLQLAAIGTAAAFNRSTSAELAFGGTAVSSSPRPRRSQLLHSDIKPIGWYFLRKIFKKLLPKVMRLCYRQGIMDLDVSSLPDDSADLKEIVISLAASRADLEEKEHRYQCRIDYLQERIRLLQNELFGRKSEKLPKEDRDQLLLFNEVESTEAASCFAQ